MTVEPGVIVEGDPVRLTQVFTNLVENAVKYSPRGARSEVSVRREGPDAVVVVRDQGRGVAPEDLDRIFEPFYQAASGPAAPRSGLGLGLALVRRLVELHGGRVSVTSEGPGRGSTFVVRLPRAAPDRAAAPAARKAGPRVLVVEDDADLREILKTALERAGYHVELAEDGPRGIEKAQASPPDAALIDIGLPGLGGFEVAPQLRAPGRRRPYLVAVTGYSESEDEQRARRAGFDAYLVKPVDTEQVVRLLDEALAEPASTRARVPRSSGTGATRSDGSVRADRVRGIRRRPPRRRPPAS